jgi:hypothetical protein
VRLVEQRLRLFQIECVEALGEPAIDRREKLAGLIPLALIGLGPRRAIGSLRGPKIQTSSIF